MDISGINGRLSGVSGIMKTEGIGDQANLFVQDQVQLGGVEKEQDPSKLLHSAASSLRKGSKGNRGGKKNSPGVSVANSLSTSAAGFLLQTDSKPEVLWKNSDCRRQIKARPLVDADGSVYFGSYDYSFYRVDKDGKTLWKKNLGGDIYSSPVKDSTNNVLVASASKSVYAYTPEGKKVWDFRTEGALTESPVVDSGGNVYIASCDNNLYKLNPQGKQEWKFTAEGTPTGPVFDDKGNLYFCDVKGNLFSTDADGNKRWSVKMSDDTFERPAIGPDGKVYAGCSDGQVHCFNPADGTCEWSLETNWAISSSPVFTSRGLLLVSNQDGNLYAIDTGKKEVAWKFDVEGYDLTAPLENEMGNIYVAGRENLYCLSPQGSQLWKSELKEKITSEIALSPDKKNIYLGTEDGTLIAFSRKDIVPEGIAVPGENPNTDSNKMPDVEKTETSVIIGGVELNKKKKKFYKMS